MKAIPNVQIHAEGDRRGTARLETEWDIRTRAWILAVSNPDDIDRGWGCGILMRAAELRQLRQLRDWADAALAGLEEPTDSERGAKELAGKLGIRVTAGFMVVLDAQLPGHYFAQSDARTCTHHADPGDTPDDVWQATFKFLQGEMKT